jgi:hypothetical protein
MKSLSRFACPHVLATLFLLSGGCEQAADQAVAVDAVLPAFPSAPLIDPNSATEAELDRIPGLTQAVIDAVITNRPFATPTELHAAIGGQLSEEDQRSVYRLMFVKVGLNSGVEDDYKLIPSTMSPRKLAHEFEEYRPYESIDQFRREMAKYVSDPEVDHLTRYVTVD